MIGKKKVSRNKFITDSPDKRKSVKKSRTFVSWQS